MPKTATHIVAHVRHSGGLSCRRWYGSQLGNPDGRCPLSVPARCCFSILRSLSCPIIAPLLRCKCSSQSLFQWIVAVINSSLGKDEDEDGLPFIGVLDIFGTFLPRHAWRTTALDFVGRSCDDFVLLVGLHEHEGVLLLGESVYERMTLMLYRRCCALSEML